MKSWRKRERNENGLGGSVTVTFVLYITYYYYRSIIILIILNEIKSCHLSGSLSSYLEFQAGDQQIQYKIKGNIIPDA